MDTTRALCYIEEGGQDGSYLKVKDFVEDTSWNSNKLREHISEDMVNHVVKDVKPVVNEDRDTTWWTGNSKGGLSVKSTFHSIRKKKEKCD